MSFVNAQGKRSRPRHQGHLSSSEIGRLLHTHGGAGLVVRFQARKARQSSGDTLYGAKSKSEGVRFWQVPRQAQTRRVEASQSSREKMVRLEDRRRGASELALYLDRLLICVQDAYQKEAVFHCVSCQCCHELPSTSAMLKHLNTQEPGCEVRRQVGLIRVKERHKSQMWSIDDGQD